MSASNTCRRLSLLTSSSLLAAVVLAGAGGAALAPTAAFAANECGDPGTNAATADTFTCVGTFGSITYPATNGNLTLRLQNNVTTTTGGLVVTATGANNVTISRLADSPVNSGDPSLTSTAGAGIQITRAVGGTINVNLTDDDTTDAALVISGTTAGVLLQNTGTGNTTFTSTNGTITASAGAGIDASTTSVAAGTVTVTTGSVVTGSTYGIRAATAGTGTITIANTGSVSGGTGAVLVASGTNATLTNSAGATIAGPVVFSNTGTSSFANNGAWNASGNSLLGGGASTLTNSTTATISTTGATAVDFGAGADSFTNTGIVVVGGGGGAATLTFTGLETWTNDGNLLFGVNATGTGSDGAAGDRAVSAGTLFTGVALSKFFLDVDLSADQADCSAALTADCLDLRGSSTAGATSVVVNLVGDPFAQADRVVLVDVAGAGTSAAGHFTLNADSSTYQVIGGAGTLESGLFFYTLDYDATAKQHVLEAAAFNGKALELARLGYAVAEPWRTATGMWQDRQSDLRDTVGGDAGQAGPGVWLRAAGTVTNEDRFDFLAVAGDQVGYNISSHQRTTAIVGGVDLVRMVGDDGAWVAGVTAGKLDSTLERRAGTSGLELDGYSLGAYATLVAGRAFVDGIVSRTSLDLTHSDFGRAFESSAKSIGYQVEGGYRAFQLNDDGAYIEPIAALSYVKTQIDDLTVGNVTGTFGDAVSLRAAVGLRIAGDLASDVVTARLAFTGRLWKEFDGDGQTTLSASFGDTTIAGQPVDTLGDVGVAISLFAPGGPLSAQFGYSLKFGEGYESSNAGLSVRFNW